MLLFLVAVSGAECVEALTSAGFALRSRSPSAFTLTRAERSVVVRDVGMLVPDELNAVLCAAGLTYSDFLDLLSEAPTDPDVHRTMRAAAAAAE